MQVLHALGHEAHPITRPEQPVVGKRLSGQFVDGRVADHDPQIVASRMHKWRDIDAVGWVPDHAGALAVHIDFSCLANRWIEIGAHVEFAGRRWDGFRSRRSKIQQKSRARFNLVWTNIEALLVSPLAGEVLRLRIAAPRSKPIHRC